MVWAGQNNSNDCKFVYLRFVITVIRNLVNVGKAWWIRNRFAWIDDSVLTWSNVPRRQIELNFISSTVEPFCLKKKAYLKVNDVLPYLISCVTSRVMPFCWVVKILANLALLDTSVVLKHINQYTVVGYFAEFGPEFWEISSEHREQGCHGAEIVPRGICHICHCEGMLEISVTISN